MYCTLGSIPNLIGSLSALTSLDFHLNSLTGRFVICVHYFDYSLFMIGTVPYVVCQLTNLQVLYLNANPGIACAPLCVSSISNSTRSVPSTICVYPQDTGLCGLIAATNIHSISGYSQWSCASSGYTATNPCLSPVWNGLSCNGINVNSVNFANIVLSGSITSAIGSISGLSYINLEGNKLIGIVYFISCLFFV